jgi:CheY-like chemotaxis protein
MINRRVLIIDHYDATLDLLVEVLQNEGYTALRYPGSHLSAQRVADAQADLLVLELGISDGDDALRLIRDLRQHPDMRALPVIANSTNTRLLNNLGPELDDLGCVALEKPFDLDDLCSLIGSLIARCDQTQSLACRANAG